MKQPADHISSAKYDRKELYLQSKRKEPKHMFRVLGAKIGKLTAGNKSASLLDVGAAAGEFVAYLKESFEGMEITGLEYDPLLHKAAQEKIRGCRFVCGDANHMDMFKDKQFDVVTMVGVMSIFDDFVPSLSECLRVTKDKGAVLVVGQFNEHPVDVLVRWRYAGKTGPYQPGRNLFSKKSVGDYLNAQGRVKKWDFEKFTLPFDLPPQEDPVRSWTELDKDGQRVFKSGLGVDVNLQILTITLKDR